MPLKNLFLCCVGAQHSDGEEDEIKEKPKKEKKKKWKLKLKMWKKEKKDKPATCPPPAKEPVNNASNFTSCTSPSASTDPAPTSLAPTPTPCVAFAEEGPVTQSKTSPSDSHKKSSCSLDTLCVDNSGHQTQISNSPRDHSASTNEFSTSDSSNCSESPVNSSGKASNEKSSTTSEPLCCVDDSKDETQISSSPRDHTVSANDVSTLDCANCSESPENSPSSSSDEKSSSSSDSLGCVDNCKRQTISSRDHTVLGLPNIGNTCYMNATLQCLFGLKQFIEEVGQQRNCGLDVKSHVIKCLSDLCLARASAMNEKAGLLRAFKKSVASVFSDFSGDEQQDAHEFLSVLLSQLKEEWQYMKRTDSLCPEVCPVESTFQFRVQVERTCCSCGEQVCGTESYSHLSLDIVPQGTIEDSLKQYFRVEQVERRCHNCPCQLASVKTKILSLPRVLVLQLKRFEMDSTWNLRKLKARVDIQNKLTLHPYCVQDVEVPCETDKTTSDSSGIESLSEDEQLQLAIKLSMQCFTSSPEEVEDQIGMEQGQRIGDKQGSYKLSSILSHLGWSMTCGHYVSDRYNGDNTWLTFDDHKVTKVCWDTILPERERSAYLLFYVYSDAAEHKV